MIPRQTYTVDVLPGEFVQEVSPCRTFVTEEKPRSARSGDRQAPESGRSGRVRPAGRSRIDSAMPMNPRHKVLDMIGDLALCGFDLAGHVVAYRSGHALNVELARRLVAESSRHQIITSSRHRATRPDVIRPNDLTTL